MSIPLCKIASRTVPLEVHVKFLQALISRTQRYCPEIQCLANSIWNAVAMVVNGSRTQYRDLLVTHKSIISLTSSSDENIVVVMKDNIYLRHCLSRL